MNENEPTVLVLDAPATRAFDALALYFDRLYQIGFRQTYWQLPPHIVARTSWRTPVSAAAAWNLGAMVLARAAGDCPLPTEDAMVNGARALEEAIATETRSWPAELEAISQAFEKVRSESPDRFPPKLDALAWFGRRATREQNCASAGALLQEIASEERVMGVAIETKSDGQPVIRAHPLDPATAATMSYVRLLEILDWQYKSEPLVSMERQASRWSFDSWSARPRGDWDALCQNFREQEFSLFDRKMLSLRNVTLAAAAARDLPPKALTRRQRALLDDIGRAVCGLFVVRQRRGPMAVLEDIDSSIRYEIRELPMSEEYGEGFLVLGRLILDREIGWIRSPGAIISTPASEEKLSVLRSALREREDVYRSLLVELVNAACRGEELPRFVQPAPSPELAEDLHDDFCEWMSEEGLGREEAAATARVREALTELGASPDLASCAHTVEMEVDQVLKEWLRALREQAEAPLNRWGVDHDSAQRRREMEKKARYRRRRQ